MCSFDSFSNNLRRLLNIDMCELVAAGVIEAGDMEAWRHFRDDPHRWFIRAPEAQAMKVWRIMERSPVERADV